MNLSELNYTYPSELIATTRASATRVLYSQSNQKPTELTKSSMLDHFEKNDCLVINDTKVLKRRVLSEEGFEVLFTEKLAPKTWQVLFPSSRLKKNQSLKLPDGVELSLLEKGIPQTITLNKDVGEEYFENFGQMAIPPYIQKARNERSNFKEDVSWYQTQWAQKPGSCAAPTASLHFSNDDLEKLKSKGVIIAPVTLHVGLGTFLPIRDLDIKNHKMHHELVSITNVPLQKIENTKQSENKIWAMGTTAARVLESLPFDYFTKQADGSLSGSTDLFLYPGKKFNYVDVLMTNFHQPESTLLALVAAFAGTERVKEAYTWAIENKFNLFSYGDLSVWQKS